MNILDQIAQKFGYVSTAKARKDTEQVKNKIISLISASTSSGTGSSATAPDLAYSRLVDSYTSWVYTAIDKIAKSVATLKLRLYVYRSSGSRAKVILPGSVREELKALPTEARRNKFLVEKGLRREELVDHPWVELVNRPNATTTRFLLWYETMVRLELSGSVGWYMPPTRLGLPGEIWTLPLMKTASLTPKIDSFGRILSWSYVDGNVRATIPPEEVLWMKYPHPGSPFKGMSPLMAQTYPYDIDLYLSQRQKALFENQAVPGLNLHTDQNFSPEQAAEIKEFLDLQFAGVRKAGKSLFTHSGLKAMPLSVNNREAMISEVARQAREKILTAYDTPEGVIGLVRDVNRANMEGLTEMFVRGCLLPKTMLIEEYIETFMLPRYDEGLSCDFQLPDLEDREFELNAMETRLKALVSTVNEEREAQGKERVPWGDVPWIPSTMTQYGTEPVAPTPSGKDADGAALPLPTRGNGLDSDEINPWGDAWRT